MSLYVCGIGLFSCLTCVHFGNFVSGRYMVESVKNISRDDGGECRNEKGKRCNIIPLKIPLRRNYATGRISYGGIYHYMQYQKINA